MNEFNGMVTLDESELSDINGGFAWIPVLVVGGAVVLVASAVGVGVYNGYKDAEAAARK